MGRDYNLTSVTPDGFLPDVKHMRISVFGVGFPKDATTCQKWVDAVRHERRDPWWNSSNASRICSMHFKETDISSTPCKVNILAKSAVPVCTMVWYDENDNNTTSKTSNETTNTDKLILKTYERKKTNINVLKELKVNTSYNWNKEGTTMSKTNSVVISNTAPYLSQDNLPQDTKLLKALEVSKIQNLKKFQETNRIANANVTKAQKNTVLTESNKKDYDKSCKEKCCKSKIFVKLNDNTSLILDEDLSNYDTIFRNSTKVRQETNSRTCENSKKVTLKQFNSNENKELNEPTYIFNDGNVESNANISKSYVGKMLRTYLPKRKDKIIEKNIRESSKLLKINKNIWSITMEKGLNVNRKEVNKTNVNEHPKDKFSKKLNTGICNKSNIIADLQSNKNPQEKNQSALLNVKKYTFKRSSNLFKRPRIREQKTVGVQPNMDVNKESNIAHIDEFISNQLRIHNIKEPVTAVYDEIISELFETSKNVRNVSNIPFNDNCQLINKNVCIDNNVDSNLNKGTSNRHVILEKNTNIYTELNTIMDMELCRVMNCDKKEFNTDKSTIAENTMIETDKKMAIINKNMCHNENITNNATFLPNNELPNLETSVLNNIVPETKKENFTELKKYLSMKPKLESPSELCTNALIDIDKNIFSRYDNITSTSITKDNLQVSDRDHDTEFNNNIGIDDNDMTTSLQCNFNTDATNEKESNSINSKQLNPILYGEFINNISPESNNSRNVDFITNFQTEPDTTREPESNEKSNIESKKTLEKDMPDLDAVMNLELCSEVNIGINSEKKTKFNTDKTDNVDFSHYNENTSTKSNQKLSMMNKNMSMEQSDHFFPISNESDYHLSTVMNEYNTTQFNKNMCHNEYITNNPIIISNNELQHQETSVSNIITETKKDNFNELKKHLSTKTNLDFAELCKDTLTHTTLSDSTMSTAITKENIEIADRAYDAKFDKNTSIVVNDITSLQNNMNTESILLEELIRNTSTENFIENLKTNPNTTRETMNKNKISDITYCKKSVEKDMPELNAAIPSELNEDKVLKSDGVMNRKFHHSSTEMYADKDLLFQKKKKDFVNVLATSDDQNTVVHDHMDVVDGILNRDIAAEFDLSLLLSDTPIPDEEIQNLNNNSDNNSLDGILGSPNWIQLPTGEMPKIIDDILDQGSPFFENLDLFDKANKFKIDKEANKKDSEIKKLISEKYSTPNLEQFCENGKQCTKNSIAQIEKQLIAELSDCNETILKQRNNICNENEVSPPKKVTAEKYNDLCDKQTDKQIPEQYLQSNDEQWEKFNLDQIIAQRNENRDKEIQFGDITINQCQLQNNVDSKDIQIEDPRINQYFEQSETFHRGQDGLGTNNAMDKVFNDVDTFKISKNQCYKQSNEQMYKSSVGKCIIMEESIPKSKMHSQGTVESNVQEINRQLFEDCDVKRINNVPNAAHIAVTESVPELNIGQLKRVIFEQCYDPDCRNDCKNQNHNFNTESHKKDDEQYKKQTNYTLCQPDIEKRKRRYDLLYKRECYQTGTENFKKQLQNSSFHPNTKEMKNKSFLERHKLSHNEKYKTKYKKIAIDHIPGQYLELRWKESEGKSNTLSQEGCKRKHKELGLNQRKMLCSESTNNVSHQIMAECPECGYSTDDNDLMNFKSNVDLRITKPLSLINKDMLISLHDIETENNGKRNRVTLESVYAMEVAYVTAIQALERKLKQKIAISEYRLRRVNNLSKINKQLTNANITLMDLFYRNKV